MATIHDTLHGGPGHATGEASSFWGYYAEVNYSNKPIYPGRVVVFVGATGGGDEVRVNQNPACSYGIAGVVGAQTIVAGGRGYVVAAGPADVFITGTCAVEDQIKAAPGPYGAAMAATAGDPGDNIIFGQTLEAKAATAGALVRCFIFPHRH